jgi:hypothetical protein
MSYGEPRLVTMRALREKIRLTISAKTRRMLAVFTVLGGALACVLVAHGPALAAVPLPDGRVWEMVSPLAKNGGEINGIDGVVPDEGLPEGGIVQASANGSLITYVSLLAFAGSSGGEPQGAPLASQYLSTRMQDGWSTANITTTANSDTYSPAGSGAPYRAFSSDLSLGLMQNGSPSPVENPPLIDSPPRYQNYYMRNNLSGKFVEAILTKPPQEEPGQFFLELVGVTPDLRHVAVKTEAALTPEATPQERRNLYEWSSNWPQSLEPINVLPEAGHSGQTAGGGAWLGMGNDENHTISSDGSRVFWSQPATARLFVRKNMGTDQATTVQVDASREGEDPGEQGEFKTASSDGSRVFFTDKNRLTPGSTAGRSSAHEDLYMFDVNTEQLTDLTIDTSDPEGASVLGVLDASEDGSYVYFVAEGKLPNTEATTGSDNLYVWQEGTIKFIGTLSAKDNDHAGFHDPGVAHDWALSTGERTARVTADGRYLVFMSDAHLTNYDNRDANSLSGARDEEVYLYDAVSGGLTCISCNQNGSRPIGLSGIPGGTAWRTVGELGTYQSRVLSKDGSHVFFDSSDALVSQDVNGVQDVYEWERGGVGTCHRESGCIFLISGATSSSDSSFVDANAEGSDVFFVTRAELVGQDTDQLRDLYDARVSGGFPPPPPTTPPCDGDGCLPSASMPVTVEPLASTTFSGVGNLYSAASKPVAKAKSKKHGKPKKHQRRKKDVGRKASAYEHHRLQERRKS